MRLLYILGILIKYSFLFFLTKIKIYNIPTSKLLYNFFGDAGGSFIKFGQLLAMRVDILPPEYTLELINLLDNVKHSSYKEVRQVFLQELGATPEKIFKDFQKEPFASASFAQVHGAKLEDNTIVAVKILRPGIEQKIQIDFFIVDILAFIADIFYKIEALPWKEFSKEFRKWTLKELDYHIEAKNTERARLAFIDSKYTVIPKIYFRYSTKRILVEEYIEGIHLGRVLRGFRDGRLNREELLKRGVDIKKTVRIITSELFKQLFFHGFFHADPHPGNIILLPDGKIGMIDFGIIGEKMPGKQSSFIKSLRYDTELKFKEAAYYFADFSGGKLRQLIASAFPASVDERYIDEFMRTLTDHFSKQVEHMYLTSRDNINSLKKDSASLLVEVLRAANKYKIKIPSQAVLFIRALGIFGLLAKELDSTYEIGYELKVFFEKYYDKIIVKDDPIAISSQRINRERALEKLNNWMTYLLEKDPEVYNLVNTYIKRYNIVET